MDDDDNDNTTDQPSPFGAMWANMWSKNWLIPVVLLLLREWSTYGYELWERMASFGFAMMDRSTFYRVLRQMEKDGMVSSAWDTSGDGPARRTYSITDIGEAYLQWWADTFGQYQKLMETLFQLPADRPQERKTDDPRRARGGRPPRTGLER